MNCYDCAKDGSSTTVSAACHDHGAGICREHATEHRGRITAAFAWNHSARIDPPQRRFRGTTCAEAINAINDARRPVGRRKAG